ncbi:MAG: hypothetical protein M1839_008158 [Geoglossum umbratile]|nr:MAG: hypothetical protein M1839_008158 [Geoglossum umbratile]
MVATNPPTTPKRITGKYKTILTGFLVLAIPLSALVAILLGLIFHYRLKHNVISGFSIQSPKTRDESGVLYVNLNLTFLMKVASLSSTIATFLTTFGWVPSGVRGAHQDKRWGAGWAFDALSVLGLLENAGIVSVWRWLKFAFSRRRNTPSSLSGFDSGRVLIFTTETWLHFKTKPFEFAQIEPLQRNTVTYSKILSSNCTSQDNTYNDQEKNECTFSPSIRGGFFLDPITALEVFNNISATTSVNVYGGVYPPHAFLGVPGNGVPQQRDFVATTFPIATQCKPATGDCGVSRDNITSGAGSIFHCQKYSAWWGLVNGAPTYFNKQYFTDSTGTKNASGTDAKVSNPFYVSFNGMTNPASSATLTLIKNNDLGVIAQEFGGIGYLHFCDATVYEVKYTVVNGSITEFTAKLSNGSVATALLTADRNLNAGDLQLRAAADLGALVSNTSQQMADIFALEYSRVLLSQHLVAERMEQEKGGMPVGSLDEEFIENTTTGLAKRIGIGKRDQVVGGWELKIWEP